MRMTTTAGKAALAACGIAFTIGAAYRLVPIIRDQLVAPFDLISEGPHLEGIKAIREGFNIYAPESYQGPPFHIIPYVPLFYVLVAALPADPGNPFFTGRMCSMLFMFASAASLFAVARPREWIGIPLVALACFFLIRPVVGNTAYLRSDEAGLFFSVAAVMTVANGVTRRRAVSAALLCAVAIACKQSFIAASATCFLYLLLWDRRLAVVFALATAGFVAVLATVATAYWGRGFWFCVFLPATYYPRDWPSFFDHWNDMWKQPVFTFIAATLGVVSLAALIRRRITFFTATPYFLYVVVSVLVQQIPLSGIGASNHYFFEPVLATLLWLVWSSTQIAPDALFDWKLAGMLAVLGLCTIAELRDPNSAEYRYTTATATAEHVRNRAWVIDQMNRRGIRHGELLNLKHSPVTSDYPGRVNVDDPYLFFVLWETGGLSTEPLLRAIAEHHFDAAIVAPTLVNAEGQTADNPVQNVIRALFRDYELAIHGVDVNVLTPRPSARQTAGGR
jgi:hypothetical protein